MPGTSTIPVKVVLVGTHVGAKIAKVLLGTAVSGKLTPELLGEAIMSSSSVRTHVQTETLRFIAMRVSMQSPSRMVWLVKLVTDFLATQSTDTAIRNLGSRTMFYHISTYGIKGSVASALATAAVSATFTTCSLITSNAQFWREAEDKMSFAQYRYDLATVCYVSAGSVAGSGVGAALGTLLLPGFGTALGSIVFSMGGAYLPSKVRTSRGPDDRRRAHVKELLGYTPLLMRECEDGFVEMYQVSDSGRDSEGGVLALKTEEEQQEEGEGAECSKAVEGHAEDSVIAFSRAPELRTAAEGEDEHVKMHSQISFSPLTVPDPAAPVGDDALDYDIDFEDLHSTIQRVPGGSGGGGVTLGDNEALRLLSQATVSESNGNTTDDGAGTAVKDVLRAMYECLGGKVESLEGNSWEEINKKMEEVSKEDDLVFVFRVGDTSAC